MSKLWDFLEENMHHYSSDSRIFQIDVLCRFQDEELTDEQIEEYGLTETSTCDAHEEEMRLTDICFQEALENFTSKSKIQMCFNAMLKGDYVMVSKEALENSGCPDLNPRMRITSIYSDSIMSLTDDDMDIISEITIEDIEFINHEK